MVEPLIVVTKTSRGFSAESTARGIQAFFSSLSKEEAEQTGISEIRIVDTIDGALAEIRKGSEGHFTVLFLSQFALHDAIALAGFHSPLVHVVCLVDDERMEGKEEGVTIIGNFRMIAGESIFDLIRRPKSS